MNEVKWMNKWLNELTWMNSNEWIETNEVSWMNLSEWIETNELKWMSWHEWFEMSELKWMNWNEWTDKRNWNEWIEVNELTWTNWNELKWMNWHESIEMNQLTWMTCQKWLETLSFFTFFMWSRALATVSRTFCRPNLPKVLRAPQFFNIFQVEIELSLQSCAHFVDHFPRSSRAPAETATTAATLPEKIQGFAPKSVFKPEFTRSRS